MSEKPQQGIRPPASSSSYVPLPSIPPLPSQSSNVWLPDSARKSSKVSPPPDKMTRELDDGGGMPNPDAMDYVLPEYQYIFMDQPQAGSKPEPGPSRDLDATKYHLLDHQMRELDRYRMAVQKMGSDILALRQQIRELEVTNSQLRRDLTHYNDSTRFLLDSSELDGLTKPELVSRYVSLKQTLSGQTADLTSYKERVQDLQNQLIKKNDQEKEYIKLRDAHKSQQQLVQRIQEVLQREKKLKEACKKQELVIEKMEGLLNKKDDKGKGRNDKKLEALAEENARLRGELAELKSERGRPPADDKEKLELYQLLDKAEGRIMSLEKQLAENARRWGKEKNELQTRLQESEVGLGRHSRTNDYAHRESTEATLYKLYTIAPETTGHYKSRDKTARNSQDPYYEPRRYSRAPRSKSQKLKPVV